MNNKMNVGRIGLRGLFAGLIILVCLNASAVARDDYGFRVLGRVLPGEAGGTYAVGNYCYLGAGNALQVYNIANSAAPVMLGQLPLKGLVNEVLVNGNYAYIADDDCGLVIADITTPSQITAVSHLDLPNYIMGVNIVGNYAYLPALEDGLLIVDITDPQLPLFVSSATITYGAISSDVQDTLAAVACGYGGLYFFNVANPNAPSQLSLLDVTGTWVYDVKIRGNYAYMAYALDPDGGGLKVIDISNPAAPQIVGNLITSYSFRRMELDGNYAFIAAETGGLLVANISNPTNPRLAGAWQSGFGSDVSYSGNTIYLSGAAEGVRLLSALNILFPQLTSTIPTFSACQDVDVAGHYAYMVEKPSGIRVIDLQNIQTPLSVYSHQFYFENGAYQGVGEGVSIVGDHMYVVDYNDIYGGHNDFRIYGLSNPVQPDSQGIYMLTSSPRGHRVRDDIAYIATGQSMKMLDVRDPSSIELVSSFQGDWNSAYALELAGNYIYLGTMNTGLRILDVTNEVSPVIAGAFDTQGGTYAARYHDGYAYLADDTQGLRIVNVTVPSSPYEVAGLTTYTGCVDVGFVDDSIGTYAIGLFDNEVLAYDISNPAQPVEVGYYATIDPHHVVTRGDTIYVADRKNGLHVLLLEHQDRIDDQAEIQLPRDAIIVNNYPNPFNSSTMIEFTLPEAGLARLEICDIGGRKIAEPFNGQAARGINKIIWNGIDNSGRQLAGGVYFYRVISGERNAVGRMIFLK